MKRRYFVSFSVPLSDSERFRDYVESIGCLESWQEPFTDRGRPSLYHTFNEDDPNLAALRELLKKEGINWSEREEHVYTDDELRSFPMLELAAERTALEAGGPEYGTTYDLSDACPQCGTGAVQTSSLVLPMVGLPNTGLLYEAGDGEKLVAEKLMKALLEAKVTGLELRQVRRHGNGEPLPWWQIVCEHTMPKTSPQTMGWVRSARLPPCPSCQRDGYYHTQGPYMIVYRREDVDFTRVPDIARTWESFGTSGINKEQPQFSRFGDHRMLIKPRVFDIFRRLKVRHAVFTPVRIEN